MSEETVEEGRRSDEPHELPEGWMWTTLGEVCQVNPRDGSARDLSDDTAVSFVPMAAVDAGSGTIANGEERPLKTVRKGFTRFADGDVIIAKITPSMENGKAAIARGLKNGLGFGSTEFHVLRPLPDILPEYVFYFVRQQFFRDEAKANFAGTAGQLRVPSRFLVEHAFPLAPLPEQRRIVAKIEELLTSLDAGVAGLKRIQAALKRYRAAVLKAACEGRLVPQDSSDEPAEKLLERLHKARRQQLYEAKRNELKSRLEFQISSDGVHRAPNTVVVDWLIEMVLNDFDKLPGNPIDGLAASFFGRVSAKVSYTSVTEGPIRRFFETVHDNIQIGTTNRNYVLWLEEAIGVLASQGIESKILDSQLRVWVEYINTEQNVTRLPRTIHVPFGAAGSMLDGIGQWLAAESIRSISLSDIRHAHIDAPVENEWQRERNQQTFSEPDDSVSLPPGWRLRVDHNWENSRVFGS